MVKRSAEQVAKVTSGLGGNEAPWRPSQHRSKTSEDWVDETEYLTSTKHLKGHQGNFRLPSSQQMTSTDTSSESDVSEKDDEDDDNERSGLVVEVPRVSEKVTLHKSLKDQGSKKSAKKTESRHSETWAPGSFETAQKTSKPGASFEPSVTSTSSKAVSKKAEKHQQQAHAASLGKAGPAFAEEAPPHAQKLRMNAAEIPSAKVKPPTSSSKAMKSVVDDDNVDTSEMSPPDVSLAAMPEVVSQHADLIAEILCRTADFMTDLASFVAQKRHFAWKPKSSSDLDKQNKKMNRKLVVRDPNEPKRPLSAYNLWCDHMRKKFRETDPDKSLTLVDLAELWKTSEDKMHWEQIAREQKTVYERRLAAYKATHSPVEAQK